MQHFLSKAFFGSVNFPQGHSPGASSVLAILGSGGPISSSADGATVSPPFDGGGDFCASSFPCKSIHIRNFCQNVCPWKNFDVVYMGRVPRKNNRRKKQDGWIGSHPRVQNFSTVLLLTIVTTPFISYHKTRHNTLENNYLVFCTLNSLGFHQKIHNENRTLFALQQKSLGNKNTQGGDTCCQKYVPKFGTVFAPKIQILPFHGFCSEVLII